MTTPFDLADRLVDELLALLPPLATSLGIPGHDHRWGDTGPEGSDALADLARRYRSALADHLDDEDPDQRHAARVVSAFFSERLAGYERGDHLRDLGHTASGFQGFREIFDIMDKGSLEGWQAICARLETLDEALTGYRRRLEVGLARRDTVAVRQVRSVLDQARELAGDRSAYHLLSGQAEASGFHTIRDRLDAAVGRARAAMADFARFLERSYLPHAQPEDGVGPERYAPQAERFLGLAIDPLEVYEWGWEELARLRSEALRVGNQIVPGVSVREVADLLEGDPERAAPSLDAFLAFVAERQERALADLDGSHFDVPPEGRIVTVNAAPPGGALGAYYLAPSEDFTRPGGIWYSVGDHTTFPRYQEVSTAYHEGFPGHHLQIVTAMANRDRLCRAHRALIWYPGYGEGWALYAERLMEELGYLEQPDYVFGMLASHLFRAARVVVDIGCHLGLEIPAGAPIAAGERWTFETAVAYMEQIGLQPTAYARSDVTRYLGWPGQAISYKVGEREILALRDEDRRRRGAAFDLKDFHHRVLDNGELRLDMLREVVLGS